MRNQKGITLIALVITIIVLLILAGVTIAMLSGDNGILGRATTTKEANAESTAREQANLAYMAVRTEIAAEKVKDGTYKPNATSDASKVDGKTAIERLEAIVKADLQPDSTKTKPWSVSASGAVITMVFSDDALNNASHTLTYTITMDDKTATLAEPTNPGYNQINK